MGETFTYEFGAPINRYEQVLDVTMDLGSTKDFAFYDKINNSYVLEKALVNPGYWKLSVFASEVNKDRIYSYQKSFYLRVLILEGIDDNPVAIDSEIG